VAVVVSEEHGTISIAHNGRIIRRLDAQRLETVLRAFFQLDRQTTPSRWTRGLRRVLGLRNQPSKPSDTKISPRRTVDG
jgi:hypothetical protein